MVSYTVVDPQRLHQVYRHVCDEGQTARIKRVFDIMSRDHATGYITTDDEVVIEQIEMEMFNGCQLGQGASGGYLCML